METPTSTLTQTIAPTSSSTATPTIFSTETAPAPSPSSPYTATPDRYNPPPFSRGSFLALTSGLPIEVNVYNFSDLRNAIDNANSQCGGANPRPTIINLLTQGGASNPYHVSEAYRTGFFGLNAFPTIRCDTTINGYNQVISRAATTPSANRFRFFAVTAKATFVLNNVILQNAISSNSGGAIFIFDGTLEINRSIIQGNTVSVTTAAQILGAGIYAYSEVGKQNTIRITDSTIIGNWNQGGEAADGGGLAIIAGQATITRTAIKGNSTNRDGGGVFLYTGANPLGFTMTDSFITQNTAYGRGSAIFNSSIPDCPFSKLTTITRTCIVGNDETHTSVFATGAQLRADGNWWGANSAPTQNPAAAGDNIGAEAPGSVDADSFLSAPLPNDCLQAAQPPTPTPTVNFSTNTPSAPSNTPTAVTFATNTPQGGSTSTPSWQQLATNFPLPLVTTPQARLSDPDYVDRAYPTPGGPTPNPTNVQPLCSRDVNRPGGGMNFPAIASAGGEVMIVDLAQNGTDNQNLGNFVVIRIPIQGLPASVKQALISSLSQNSANANVVFLINNNVGWIWMGYAHLNSVSVSGWTPSNYPPVSANAQLGLSGNSGLQFPAPLATGTPHLDISAYYISGEITPPIRASLPIPIATNVGTVNPITSQYGLTLPEPYSVYFGFFKNRAVYGPVALIDPLWLWPIIQDGATFQNGIDMICP